MPGSENPDPMSNRAAWILAGGLIAAALVVVGGAYIGNQPGELAPAAPSGPGSPPAGAPTPGPTETPTILKPEEAINIIEVPPQP